MRSNNNKDFFFLFINIVTFLVGLCIKPSAHSNSKTDNGPIVVCILVVLCFLMSIVFVKGIVLVKSSEL